MTNLVQELGVERFRQKFGGSFFFDDEGLPCVINTVDNGGVSVGCTSVSGDVKNIRVNPKVLPSDFFASLATFKVPKLGWRMAYEGRYLAYLSRDNRSYHRGISQGNLTTDLSALTKWLMRTNNFSVPFSANKLCTLALRPEYMPLSEGIAAMRAGELLSFAVSPDIAVVPSEDDTYDVYFRQNQAGKIMPDDSLQVTVPLLANYLKDLQ